MAVNNIEKSNNASQFPSRRSCVITFSSSLSELTLSSAFNDPSTPLSALALIATTKTTNQNEMAGASISIFLEGGRGIVLKGDQSSSRLIEWNVEDSSPKDKYLLSVKNVFIKKFGGFHLPDSANGGCVSVTGNKKTYNAQLMLENVTMSECTATDTDASFTDMSGGALYVSRASTCNISRCNFHDNVADSGGSVYLELSNEIHFEHTTIKNSFTLRNTSLGGGAYFESVTVTLVNSLFLNNTALGDSLFSNGGGAFFSFSNASLVSTTF